MTPDEADEYVGLPYKEGGFGPDAYNCWGLLQEVQLKHFGVTMPKAPIGDAARCQQMFKDHVEYGVWSSVDTPRHGDGALLRGGNEPHVGIYLDFDGGGILHALRGVGVIFTPVNQLYRLDFSKAKYYRLKNDSESDSS